MSISANVLKKVWNESPRGLLTGAERRLRRLRGAGDHGWDYSLSAVLASAKNMNAQLEIERWERQWRVCRNQGHKNLEEEFDFAGKSVLELGCGPVLGCGPMALYRGAERFWYREPDFVRAVVETKEIKDRYFRPLFEELRANYGNHCAFDDWYSRVIELSGPLPADAASLADITVSHSVLEHIPRRQLSSVLADLRRAARPGSLFFHTVDFGPHGGPFAALYLTDRDREPERLNLLRRSDMEAAITQAGFELTGTAVYKRDEIDRTLIHDSWHGYSSDDLETRVMYFVGRCPGDIPQRAN